MFHTAVSVNMNAMPDKAAILHQVFSWKAAWEGEAKPVTFWVQAGPGKDSRERWYLLHRLGETEGTGSDSPFTLGYSCSESGLGKGFLWGWEGASLAARSIQVGRAGGRCCVVIPGHRCVLQAAG